MNRRDNEPTSVLDPQVIDLLEQTRAWCARQLKIANKLCESYPNDVRVAKERELLTKLIAAIDLVCYFYAL